MLACVERLPADPDAFKTRGKSSDLSAVCATVSGWLAHPNTQVVVPGPYHWAEYERLITATSAVGNLLMDTHLAALAIEHDCWLASCDTDFAKFPDLRWINPITS